METEDKASIPPVVGSRANPMVGRVWQLAEPLCLGEGMELVHLEYRSESAGRTLRIYIDKPGGVTLDDCVNISRQMGDILDVGLDTEFSYRMEVSSPGVQRPLGRLSDFERFRGRQVKVRTSQPIQGRKNFTGTLEGVKDLSVCLTVGDQAMAIAFTDIVKARLIN